MILPWFMINRFICLSVCLWAESHNFLNGRSRYKKPSVWHWASAEYESINLNI